MGGFLAILGGPFFRPVTHTHTSGSGTESIPPGASIAVITVQGGGAGGDSMFIPMVGTSYTGGGAGGEPIKTASLAGISSFSYAVGAGGGIGANGRDSTVAGGAVSLTGSGGQVNGSGGAASGGDTNTTGGAGTSALNAPAFGGASPYGGIYGNGGGSSPSGVDGGQGGIITFAYT